MSEIQKGRPTIYGVDQPKKRSGYPQVNQALRPKEAAGHKKNETAKRAGAARMEQMPRRYVPGMDVRSMQPGVRPAGQRMDIPRRGAAAPSTRAVRDWEEMPEPEEMRRSDFASDRKLRALWSVFGILAVLLVAAIIYEVVLGNGLKETGNQRMSGQAGTQTTTQTNAQTTVQTNAAASVPAADSASMSQTSASATPDAGTADAADGANAADGAENDSADDVADDSADGSADDAVDDIPTIPVEGDGVQADAAE